MSDSKYSGSVHRAEFLTEADEKPNGDEMDVDEKPIVPVEREHDFNVNFVDDDELKSALTHLRRAKLHKTKKFTPEQLAQKTEDAQEEEYESGLTFDDTAELVRSVGLISIVVKPRPLISCGNKGFLRLLLPTKRSERKFSRGWQNSGEGYTAGFGKNAIAWWQ